MPPREREMPLIFIDHEDGMTTTREDADSPFAVQDQYGAIIAEGNSIADAHSLAARTQIRRVDI